ncbi:uncharacterized protein VTP21DRAFT_2251 [Calcarisporiella thermophila]|uniref:uncharacterized protein n=1 Tax=Calcarisporiella thermophila TaxID=911321 RepID=UPI00374280F3
MTSLSSNDQTIHYPQVHPTKVLHASSPDHGIHPRTSHDSLWNGSQEEIRPSDATATPAGMSVHPAEPDNRMLKTQPEAATARLPTDNISPLDSSSPLAPDIAKNVPTRRSTLAVLTSVSPHGESNATNIDQELSLSRRNTFATELVARTPQELEELHQLQEELARRKARLLSKRKQEEERTKVVIGTRIGEDHVNYVLMYNMLTGIRVAVSRCTAKLQRELTDADFKSAHKMSFDIKGNELTPSAKYDFKFKDYAPWVFRYLRELFGLDPADFLVSLTNKYVLSELSSSGKSGAFFYYSQDYRFIIKTIHHSEHKWMRKILKNYYEHVKKNPNTLLCRYYGLHRIKLPHGRKIHFVVMGNVFPSNKDIHEIYDLKGSTYGREYPESEARQNPRAVMKDLNWLNRGKVLQLGPEKRQIFLAQLQRDVKLLQTLNIMDYSLLIGIHNLRRGNSENLRANTLYIFKPDLKRTERKLERQPSGRRGSHGGAKEDQMSAQALRQAVVVADPVRIDSTFPEEVPSDRLNCIFYADEGGFLSSDERNGPGVENYYMGIIDILTPYDIFKKAEHFIKSFTQDKEKISAVDPTTYGLRFLQFMREAIKCHEDLPEIQL